MCFLFQLDYTLWPFYSDVHVQPPFHNTREGHVFDSKGVKVTVYAEVNRVLERVHKMNIMMAVASRSTASTGAKDLMQHLGWDKYFSAREVFPGTKVTHFHKIRNQTHVHFADMLFFDDDPRNIKDISDLGVTCILVIGGMKMADLQKGFDTYKRNHQDLTLWPFQVDKCVSPFLKRDDLVVDSQNAVCKLYPEVFQMLGYLSSLDVSLAIASRITDVAGAVQLLHNLLIRDYFDFVEIYPTRKTLHFIELKRKTGFQFEQMIFFDDDWRNIKAVSKLGVACYQVIGGVRLDFVKSVLIKLLQHYSFLINIFSYIHQQNINTFPYKNIQF